MSNKESIDLISNNLNKILLALTAASNKIAYKTKKIPIHTNDGIWMVWLRDIVRMEAEINYTKIFFTDGENLLIAKTLKDYETMLLKNNFERIHKSHLVNLYHVKKYYKKESAYVLMGDDKQIEVSRYKRELLMQRLELL